MKMLEAIEMSCLTEAEKCLFKAVMRQMTATWKEVWERPEDYRDAGAGVGGFIYYAQTELFAKRHIEDILEVLREFESDCGLLEKDENILNWYAWFALEYVICKVIDCKEGAYA